MKRYRIVCILIGPVLFMLGVYFRVLGDEAVSNYLRLVVEDAGASRIGNVFYLLSSAFELVGLIVFLIGLMLPIMRGYKE